METLRNNAIQHGNTFILDVEIDAKKYMLVAVVHSEGLSIHLYQYKQIGNITSARCFVCEKTTSKDMLDIDSVHIVQSLLIPIRS